MVEQSSSLKRTYKQSMEMTNSVDESNEHEESKFQPTVDRTPDTFLQESPIVHDIEMQSLVANYTPYQLEIRKQLRVSSAWYFILPYLPLLKIVELQAINWKFYNQFVPNAIRHLVQQADNIPANQVPIHRYPSKSVHIKGGDSTTPIVAYNHSTQRWEEIVLLEKIRPEDIPRSVRQNCERQGRPLPNKVKFKFPNTEWPYVVSVDTRPDLVYVVGGRVKSDHDQSDEVYEINVKTMRHRLKAALPEPRWAASLIGYANWLIMVGGLEQVTQVDWGQQIPDRPKINYRHHTITNKWHNDVGDIPDGRINPSLVMVDDYLIVVGGIGQTNDIFVQKLGRDWMVIPGNLPIISQSCCVQLEYPSEEWYAPKGIFELFLFGGTTEGDEDQKASYKIRIDINSKTYHAELLEESPMECADRFHSPQIWVDPMEPQKKKCAGRHYVHTVQIIQRKLDIKIDRYRKGLANDELVGQPIPGYRTAMEQLGPQKPQQ